VPIARATDPRMIRMLSSGVLSIAVNHRMFGGMKRSRIPHSASVPTMIVGIVVIRPILRQVLADTASPAQRIWVSQIGPAKNATPPPRLWMAPTCVVSGTTPVVRASHPRNSTSAPSDAPRGRIRISAAVTTETTATITSCAVRAHRDANPALERHYGHYLAPFRLESGRPAGWQFIERLQRRQRIRPSRSPRQAAMRGHVRYHRRPW
jgi:hypothetical protein